MIQHKDPKNEDLLRLQLGLPEDGDDEVDGGPAGDEGRHGHHQGGILDVPNRYAYLLNNSGSGELKKKIRVTEISVKGAGVVGSTSLSITFNLWELFSTYFLATCFRQFPYFTTFFLNIYVISLMTGEK